MTLQRLWAGMLTKTQQWSETDDPTVLIVSEDGHERLHHTFLDTAQDDQERGDANLYSVNVSTKNINRNNLTNSSVRVGIRGEDLWRPLHYFVWAAEGSKVYPIAIETELNTGLSTDHSEGNISLPLRLVKLGSSKLKINRLLVLMTTRNTEWSESSSDISLRVTKPGGATVVDFDFPSTEQQDQQRGQANFYFAPVNTSFSRSELNAQSIRLTISGNDVWRPRSFFVFGLDDASGRPEAIVPLVHVPNWALSNLSTDPSEGQASVTLPLE